MKLFTNELLPNSDQYKYLVCPHCSGNEYTEDADQKCLRCGVKVSEQKKVAEELAQSDEELDEQTRNAA